MKRIYNVDEEDFTFSSKKVKKNINNDISYCLKLHNLSGEFSELPCFFELNKNVIYVPDINSSEEEWNIFNNNVIQVFTEDLNKYINKFNEIVNTYNFELKDIGHIIDGINYKYISSKVPNKYKEIQNILFDSAISLKVVKDHIYKYYEDNDKYKLIVNIYNSFDRKKYNDEWLNEIEKNLYLKI